MATRSIVRVKSSKSTIWLYRHWDGYPACAGTFLAQRLKKLSRGYVSQRQYGTFSPLVNALVAATYDDNKRRMYEIMEADSIAGQEWEYEVACRKGSDRVMITVTELHFDKDPTVHLLSEKEFRSFCARDLLEMRRRIKAHRQKRAA